MAVASLPGSFIRWLYELWRASLRDNNSSLHVPPRMSLFQAGALGHAHVSDYRKLEDNDPERSSRIDDAGWGGYGAVVNMPHGRKVCAVHDLLSGRMTNRVSSKISPKLSTYVSSTDLAGN